jgi:hypothetical protein
MIMKECNKYMSFDQTAVITTLKTQTTKMRQLTH